MNFKKNLLANYAGQIYVLLIGIIILPLYLKYLGAAAFGLLGIYAMLQSWLRLLDMGLSPTLARQVAHARGQQTNFTDLAKLLRSLEFIFFLIALIIMFAFVLGRHFFVQQWLQANQLPYSEVSACLMLMGFMIGIRWFIDLYSGGIQGMEYQTWLNLVTICTTSMQYLGGWGFLHWISHNPVSFFYYQLTVNIVNLLIVAIKFYGLLNLKESIGFKIFLTTLKKALPFSMSMAYAVIIWIILTQLDKLLFSHLLPLTQYGYFSLVGVISGGISQLAAPLSLAILPRMTYLLAQGNPQQMLQLYRKATQFIAVLILPLSGMIAVFSQPLLYAWTGNSAAATWAAPILFWYALGNGILSVLAFQYYLQFAHGKLKLHVWFNSIFVLVASPIIIFSAYHYGPLGTAKVWFFMQLIAFLMWPPIVHRFYAPGIHKQWMLEDVLPIVTINFLVIVAIKKISHLIVLNDRINIFIILSIFGMIALLASALSSSCCRTTILNKIRTNHS